MAHQNSEDVPPGEKPAVAVAGDGTLHDVEHSIRQGAETGKTSRLSSIFGGNGVKIGPRIGPVLHSATIEISGDSDLESSDAIRNKQRALEDGHAIQYRTCSWYKVCILDPERPQIVDC